MEDLFQNISDTDYIEEVFDDIKNKPLQDYYALFISAMAYYNFIELTPEFSAKLYLSILNSSINDINGLLDKINEFLMNKHIENLEKELNDNG